MLVPPDALEDIVGSLECVNIVYFLLTDETLLLIIVQLFILEYPINTIKSKPCASLLSYCYQ